MLRANRDLLAIAHRLGRLDAVQEIESWIDKGLQGTDSFWNPKIKAFCARNMRTGELSDGFTNASALCFYADAGTQEQRTANIRAYAPDW